MPGTVNSVPWHCPRMQGMHVLLCLHTCPHWQQGNVGLGVAFGTLHSKLQRAHHQDTVTLQHLGDIQDFLAY